jgi:hypothetical protein
LRQKFGCEGIVSKRLGSTQPFRPIEALAVRREAAASVNRTSLVIFAYSFPGKDTDRLLHRTRDG